MGWELLEEGKKQENLRVDVLIIESSHETLSKLLRPPGNFLKARN